MLVDIYCQDHMDMWVSLDPHDDFNEVCDDSWGEVPNWYEYCIQEVGLATTLDVGWRPEEVTAWLLENGIAPSQPFMVRIFKPSFYRCGEYGEETDYEVEWEIVHRDPISLEDAAKAFEERSL